MKLRKVLSLLVALAMMLEVLPLSLFANDMESVAEYTVSESVTVDASSLADNDELLEGYIEQLFGTGSNSGIMLAATYTGEDALDDVNLEVYTALKSAVANIASGAESSTVIAMTLTYDCSDFGVSTLDDAITAFSESLDSTLVINYLLNDCPYELYWYDKTASVSTVQSFSGSGTTLTVKLTFTIPVASAYQASGSTTTVDSSKVTAAQTAASYAQSLVSTYSGYSDEEKLEAFKEAICSLVSYETDYASADFGDIWQLVYVFDQDTSTNVVCEGYSKAFQYLCDLAGLESIIVTGTMSGGTGAGEHMWNVVYLDGVNYLVDVTNSDTGSVGQDGGLFMVCADDADASDSSGYTFTVNNQTVSYVYDSTTLELYPEDYLTLGTVAETYYIDITTAENGTIETDVDATLGGDTVIITVTSDDGYAVASVTVTDANGNEVTVTEQSDGTYTFEMPASDVTVSATFTKPSTADEYTITVYANEDCTYDVPSSSVAGDEVTITVTPYSSDYKIYMSIQKVLEYDSEGESNSWEELAAENLSGDSSYTYTFTMPANDVEVYFLVGQYELTNVVNNPEAGTAKADHIYAFEGETIEVWTTVNDGYTLSSLTATDASGNDLSATYSYTYTFTGYYNGEDYNDTYYVYEFTMPASDVTITAVFEEIHTHTLTHVAAKDATCTEDGNTEYWYCSDCDKYFSDEDGENEITLDDTVVEATGHDYGCDAATFTLSVSAYSLIGYAQSGDTLDITLPYSLSASDDVVLPVSYTLTVNGVTVSLKGSDGTGSGTYTQTVDIGIFARDYSDSANAMISQSTSLSGDIVVTAIVDCSAYGSDCTIDVSDIGSWDFEFGYVQAGATTGAGVNADGMTITKTYESANVSWSWSDDYSTAIATFTCKNDSSHTETADATVTSETTKEATCTATGSAVYTAVVDMDGTSYTDTKTVELPMVDHTEGEAVTENEVAATCTEDGSYDTVVYCTVCNEELSRETVTVDATGHNYVATETTATCTEGGYTTYVCSECGDTYTDSETEALGHDYESVVTKEPTCTETGVMTYTCTRCGDSYTEEIEATGHDYGNPVWNWADDYSYAELTLTCNNNTSHGLITVGGAASTVVSQTCDEDGSIVYVVMIEVDGITYSDTQTVVLNATGHNWGGETSTFTFTTSAYSLFSYAMSGDALEITLPNSLSSDTTLPIAYTLTVNGVTVSLKGSDGTGSGTFTQTVDIGAFARDYSASANAMIPQFISSSSSDIVITATVDCSAYGSDCTVPADEVQDVSVAYIPESGSSATVDMTVEKSYEGADITWVWSEDNSTATATFVCLNDSSHTMEVDATVTSETTKEATCEEEGETTYTATVTINGITYTNTATEATDAIGHTYGEPEWTWIWSETEQTYTVTAKFTCTVCGGTDTETALVTSDTTDATCTATGSTVYTAVVDMDGTSYSDTKTVELQIVAHTEGEAVTEDEVAATCTTDGSYESVVYCSVCGEELSRETIMVPATGHTTEIRNAVDATCTEDGYTGDEVCTVCGETITVGTVIPATGHSFNSEGVCEACGAKTGEDGTASTVTVESDDTIFANVLPSGLVTSTTISISNDNGGTLVVSTVVEVSAYPYLVEHIADTLSFTLYNEAQGDDLISDTNSFTITTTENSKKTLKKVTILFYGDVDYSGTGTSTVTMDFASASDLSSSDIYVLHYTGSYPTWEVVTSTVTFSDTTVTVEFEASDYSPFVVLSVASASSGGSSSALDILLRISANYSEVNEAITRANALNPADYVDFSAVTEAINAVNWNLKAINQLTVNAYADAINTAIDNLVKTTATITEETVNIDEPIEATNTDTEDDIF